MNQQTELRVRTNIPDTGITATNGYISYQSNASVHAYVAGAGTVISPYTGHCTSTQNHDAQMHFHIADGEGVVYYEVSTGSTVLTSISKNSLLAFQGSGATEGTLSVNIGDYIDVTMGTGKTITIWMVPTPETIYKYEYLDLYSDIPIKLNKSFAELQDISKKNSDYTVGVTLPGTKKNNRFFEHYYNVDNTAFYFNPNQRTPCEIMIDNSPYFTGYLKLDKISVKDSAYEYDVTLYSTIGNIFGSIGNNLLKDLDFTDPEYQFNHIFSAYNIAVNWMPSNFVRTNPIPVFYPIVHNGYEYTGNTVNFSGGTVDTQSRFFTSTGPIGTWPTLNDAYNDGVVEYRFNSPSEGLIDNQLKPALSVWNLVKLIFKTYGYSVKSDFLNTPWAKSLYMYGGFSSDKVKFGYAKPVRQSYSKDEVDVLVQQRIDASCKVRCPNLGYCYVRRDMVLTYTVVKKGTNMPCLCSDTLTITSDWFEKLQWLPEGTYPSFTTTIYPGAGTAEFSRWIYMYRDSGDGCPYHLCYTNYLGTNQGASNVNVLQVPPAYDPASTDDLVYINDGDYVNFNLILSDNIKQIDFLSSFIKKFNLVIVPNKDNPKEIIIEPYDYYVGTGNIYDWTDKLSYDKGFTIEPALNYTESELILTDQDDGDAGNKEFKDKFSRIYGQNNIYNSTDFKSTAKKIDTIFSPLVFRKWDNVTDYNGLPLGINYVSSSEEEEGVVSYFYKGVKTKPKLFYFVGCFSPFVNEYGEQYSTTDTYNTYMAKLVASTTGYTNWSSYRIPAISNVMPLGNPDENKIINDNQCLLFGSETVVDIDATTFNAYSDNNIYETFYSNRINNLYDKNTRFLNGYFNLKLSDIMNLKANDLIKINEQYFAWNKIDQFNLTNPELTKVELVQTNRATKTYPERCFRYWYCNDPNQIYKFRVDFTNPNLMRTNFYFSVLYDYYVGILIKVTGINVSGYTSSFYSGGTYIPYTMEEISEADYNSPTLYTDWLYDPLLKGLTTMTGSMLHDLTPTFWQGNGLIGLNVYTGCTDFATQKAAYTIPEGTPNSVITGTCYNYYDYEVTVNDNTDSITKYPFTYYNTGNTLVTEYVTNNVPLTVFGVRELSISADSPLVQSEKVRFTTSSCFDPTTGLMILPEDYDIDVINDRIT